jgi:hypothetical protein
LEQLEHFEQLEELNSWKSLMQQLWYIDVMIPYKKEDTKKIETFYVLRATVSPPAKLRSS